MDQNTPNLNSNIYFEPPGLLGGASSGPNLELTGVGFFCTESKNSKNQICFYRSNKPHCTGIESKF